MAKTKSVEFLNLPTPNPVGFPPLVPSRLTKEEMNKSNFYRKNKEKNISNYSYTQVFSSNVKKILKIKESFLQLLNKKVEEIHKTINNSSKLKLCISIITKGPLYKQIIVSISNENINSFMKSSGEHIANINWALKSIKSDNFVNFVYLDHWSLIINSYKVTSLSDLLVVKSLC